MITNLQCIQNVLFDVFYSCEPLRSRSYNDCCRYKYISGYSQHEEIRNQNLASSFSNRKGTCDDSLPITHQEIRRSFTRDDGDDGDDGDDRYLYFVQQSVVMSDDVDHGSISFI